MARGIGPQNIKLLNKLGLDEKEAMLVRFLGPGGEPEVRLLDLAELHLPDSKDGKSPDAQCIRAAFKRHLDLLDERLGKWLHRGSWKHSLVNSSLDGASVNLGCFNGVGKLLGDSVPMQVTLHAAAHVLQLCVGDVFENCEYYLIFIDLVGRLCREYSKSGKRKAHMEELANLIDGAKALKLHGVHGIRWVASIRNVLAKIFRMLPLILADLDMRANDLFGTRALSMPTSNEMFINILFTPAEKTFQYRVTGITTDGFKAKPALTKHGVEEVTVSKMDLVRSLSGGASILRWKECAKCTRLTLSERCGKCRGFSLMELKMQVQSERFVLMLAFMIDLHEVLKGVSECFQADKTTIADVGQRVEFAIENITNCAQTCGQLESSVRRFGKTGKGPWARGSLTIDPCIETDLESHNADRRQICKDLAGSINIRYFTALDDDTVKQFSVLDPRKWPKKDAAELLVHGNVQISQLIHTYKAFFENPDGTSVPGELVLSQWKQMKKLIASDSSLSRMKFNELWPLMLDGYAQQFKFILRLVGIALTFSVDTSGCERLISLMNDLKTKFQEKMSHETLRDLVWWYKCQHHLKPDEWEAVLKRTLVRWNASGRRHQSEAIDVLQVVRLGRTEEADGGPLRIDTYEELCALETHLNRESDA